MSRIHCDYWIGHHTGTHINLYSAYAHRPLLFRCFRCCRCCAAAATASQPVSSTNHFHATPVESGYLVGSCGVATILPTTRCQSDRTVPESSGLISKGVWFEDLLLINCDCGRQFDPIAVWDAVPEPPSGATLDRTAGSISVVRSCSSLLIISQRSPDLHIYAPLATFSPSYSKSLSTVVFQILIAPHVISTRTGCCASNIRHVRGRSSKGIVLWDWYNTPVWLFTISSWPPLVSVTLACRYYLTATAAWNSSSCLW